MSQSGIPYADPDAPNPNAGMAGAPAPQLSWGQGLGLAASLAGDGFNGARGMPSNYVGGAMGAIQQANLRRALGGYQPGGNPQADAVSLIRMGVPVQQAIATVAAMRALAPVRTLSPAEAAQRGYRQGAVVQEQPSGEDNVAQASDMKSPGAVAQAFQIAAGLPETQAQRDRFATMRTRRGVPVQAAPQGGTLATPAMPAIPMLSDPSQAAALPSGQLFYTPDGQLKQVP